MIFFDKIIIKKFKFKEFWKVFQINKIEEFQIQAKKYKKFEISLHYHSTHKG